MNTIFLSADEANVDMNLKAGGVLAKVQKLTGNEKFKVRTQTTVCGVRGTEFSVKTTSDNKTVLAVKEGAVAVFPSSIDVDALKEQVEGKGEDILNIIEELEEAATMVTANQEIHVSEETVRKTEEMATAIKEAVEEIAKAEEPEVTPEKIARLTQIVAQSKDEVAKKVEPPKEISTENTEEMKQIDKMRLLDIPVARQGEKEEEKEAAPKIKLMKVSLKVTPGNAEILLNGEAVGMGKFSGIFPEGDTLGFKITRDGYISHTMNITAAEDTAKLYKISLAKIP